MISKNPSSTPKKPSNNLKMQHMVSFLLIIIYTLGMLALVLGIYMKTKTDKSENKDINVSLVSSATSNFSSNSSSNSQNSSQPVSSNLPSKSVSSVEIEFNPDEYEKYTKVKDLFEKNPGEAMAKIYATKGNFNSSKIGNDGGLFSYIGDGKLSSFIEVRDSNARKNVSDYVDQNVYYIQQNGIEKFKNKINQDLAQEGDIFNPKKDEFVNVAQLTVDAVKKSFDYSINSSTRKESDIISQLGI
jgi:hypothetical protein